ncbi:MAG: TlpA family protein disulfide reductase [Ruminococcaceae bacterium]|nr:TlpA family protein disulfide reductase [Oscillospiraceae bacterium]
MKKTLSIISLVLLLTILIVGAVLGYKHLSSKNGGFEEEIKITQNEKSDEPKGDYIDFTVYTESGKEVKLSEKVSEDKPIIINFWATWCTYCKMEMPDFNECYAEYGDQIEFMMIDICGSGQDDRAAASKYVEDEGFSFPVFYDDDLSAMAAYPTTGFPTTIVIDSNKNVVYNSSGALSKTQLLSIIEQVID